MLNINNKLYKRTVIFLILAALFVGAGLIISNSTDEFVVPTAIGDTHPEYTESEDFQYLERANRAFINLVAKTRPSIVQINTKIKLTEESTSRSDRLEQRRRLLEDWFDIPLPDNPPFREPTPSRPEGIGSGVIVSDDGYILTNNHVIQNADRIKVTLQDGSIYVAELIGKDPGNTPVSGTDLAVLKIDAEGLPALPFGDSDALEVGEWVIAIGTPLSLSQTVTRGIVSAKNRSRGLGGIAYGNFIQTDTPINRGNSGGALINIRGELVGINTLILTGGLNSGNIGIGFSIPSNTAKVLLPQLIEYGEIVRGWLGISMDSVSHQLAQKLQLDSTQGVIVNEVGKNSPAEKAGILNGDIIIEFNGKPVTGIDHLRFSVAETPVGTSVKIKVLRNGKVKQVTAKLKQRTKEALESLASRLESESEPAIIEPEELPKSDSFAGMQTQKLAPELARRYGYNNEQGVIVIKVEPDSPAADNGINVGDLIQEIDYFPIENLKDYEKAIKELEEKGEDYALVYVRSPDRRSKYITLKIEDDRTEDDR
ncbi:trypsin-like peptidase domain-containing protein [Candidatus Poribacteria bacterium]|nr:trypsin-like peptidase domain-containing protein [Candidatus Poribacteria bacterium]